MKALRLILLTLLVVIVLVGIQLGSFVPVIGFGGVLAIVSIPLIEMVESEEK